MRTKSAQKQTESNRVRNIQVKFRMTEDEYKSFAELLASSGMTTQEYLLRLIKDTPITDADSNATLLEIVRLLRDIQKQSKGIGVNANQMAKIANTNGNLPTKKKLDEITEYSMSTVKEIDNVCMLIVRVLRP